MIAVATSVGTASTESSFLTPPAYFPPASCRALREVGRGGMAVVYEACDRYHERVALKLSLPTLPQAELARFRQEARIGRRLTHPGVPRIHDDGHFAGGAWITMDYADGAPLDQRIDDPRFSAAERLHLLHSVADTLQHAHEHGVIHRDVKPSNIVLAPEHPKLLDFGIAKIVDVSMTSPDNLVGTPTHMAPEQLFGEEIDHRADIFQLGVLAHELFAHGLPWEGDHPVRLAWAVCYEPPTPISSRLRTELDVPPEVVAELERLVCASLARDPNDRPSSAAEFRWWIDALLSDVDPHAIAFGAPIWDVADRLVVFGPADLALRLPPSRELLFARCADEVLGHLLQDPRRRAVIDCQAVGAETVLDILDVLASWRRHDCVTLLCDDPDWSRQYTLRGVRVFPSRAIREIHEDLLAA